MPTINYLYNPQQNVYVIVPCDNTVAVQPAKIVQVRFNAFITGSELVYDVRVNNAVGTEVVVETDIFADKPTAITEYNNRIV